MSSANKNSVDLKELDEDALRQACPHLEFLEFDVGRKLHWRTFGVSEDDERLSRFQFPANKLLRTHLIQSVAAIATISLFLGGMIGAALCFVDEVPLRGGRNC